MLGSQSTRFPRLRRTFGKRWAAGAGFLAEGDPAGALIMRTRNGHTWFSVNGRSGATFKDNEGFYEFDLKIK